MGWFSDLFSNKVRTEAIRLGLTVSEVNRDLPIFDRRNHFQSLSSGRCVRYALSRSSGSNWELLQRDAKQGAQLPNGYFLKSHSITSSFLDKLRPIAEEFSEEYFEFEGTTTEVAVFWEEWGGKEQASRVHKVLSVMKEL